jgi:hypothetical protein
MKKILLLLTTAFCVSLGVKAQDDLLADLQKDDAAKVKQDIAIATFKSTRIVNMNSVEMTGVGNLQFMVIHHFGNIWDKSEGASNLGRLFGLNGSSASTLINFEYAPSRWANVGLMFTGQANIEAYAKLKLLRQQSGLHNYPISIAWVSNMHFNTDKNVADPNGLWWNKVSYLNQLLIARKFTENFSLQIMPSVVHFNIVAPYVVSENNVVKYQTTPKHEVLSIGIGGRYKISHKKAVTIEYTRQLNNYKNMVDATGEVVNYNPDLFSIGYDWDTGGHIFQFFVTNSSFASNITQLTSNTRKDGFGQWSLGFNLNRSYSVKKTVKTQHL